jgi:WD40 repeat protein
MSFFGNTNTAPAAPASADPKDIEVSNPPADSISKISFCPTADYLAIGSWDNNVRSPRSFSRFSFDVMWLSLETIMLTNELFFVGSYL